MDEDELEWYESEEGMRQFVEAISSPSIVNMHKHFKSVATKFGIEVGNLMLTDDFKGTIFEMRKSC